LLKSTSEQFKAPHHQKIGSLVQTFNRVYAWLFHV